MAYVPPKQALTIFNLEWRPLPRIQMLDCFGQFPQRTEQRNEHKLPRNFHSPPSPELPLCNVYTFLPETPLPLSHLLQCLDKCGSRYILGQD